MKIMASYIPYADRAFLTWLNAFLKYLFPSLARFGVPGDKYQQLATQRDDFSQKLAAAEEPATRTKLTTVQAKNDARNALEADVRQYRHCEGEARSKPEGTFLDCFAFRLAMTDTRRKLK
jgi:hypothetical protein